MFLAIKKMARRSYHTTIPLLERTKSIVLDDIMTWRKAFVDRYEKNPTQEDIMKDEQGLQFLQEWQDLESNEEQLEGDVMGLEPATMVLKEKVQGQLLEWRTNFEQQHERKPNRKDLFDDKEAADLFAQFQALTTMEYPAEMKLFLSTKIAEP